MESWGIFLGSPGDVSDERHDVARLVEGLLAHEQVDAGGRPLQFDNDLDLVLTADRAQQAQTQQLLDRSRHFVCLFGERIGTPLPGTFEFPPDCNLQDLQRLCPGLAWPWPPAGDADTADAIPLTGTVYELLLAQHRRLTALVFIKGPAQVLDASLAAKDRQFGFRAHWNRLSASSLDEETWTRDYVQQRKWLAMLVDRMAATRGAWQPFRDAADLRAKAERGLRAALGIARRLRARPSKGLKWYDVDDDAYFHGRRIVTEQLVERIESQREAHAAAAARPAGDEAPPPALSVLWGLPGSGKSSLLRAGLAAWLAKARPPGLGPWLPLVLRADEWGHEELPPAAQVADRVVACLQQAGLADATELAIAAAARDGHPQTLALLGRTVAQRLAGSRYRGLFLAVDQFEHAVEALLAPDAPRDRWQPLMQLLAGLAACGQAHVMLALPQGWKRELELRPELEWVRDALGLQAPRSAYVRLDLPDDHEIRRIIERCFEDVGSEIPRDTVDDLLEQIRQIKDEHQSPLPLLALAMLELHARGRMGRAAPAAADEPAAADTPAGPVAADGLPASVNAETNPAARTTDAVAAQGAAAGLVTLPLRERVGGGQASATEARAEARIRLHELVGNLAQQALDKVRAGRRGGWYSNARVVQGVLQKLVSIDPDAPERRTLPRVEVRQFAPRDELELVRELAEVRLVVRDHKHAQLVHDAVVAHWPVAREWFDGAKEDLQRSAVLRRDAAAWRARDRDDHYLLDPRHLPQGMQWWDVERLFGNFRDALSSEEIEFLRRSLLAHAPTEPEVAFADDPKQACPRLLWVANSGDAGVLHHYLDTLGHDPTATRPSDRRTPLHHLCFVGRSTAFDALVARLAPSALDAADHEGWTPLMIAAFNGHDTVVQTLLEAGADPWLRTPGGAHALEEACEGGHLRTAERLVQRAVRPPGGEGDDLPGTALLRVSGYQGRSVLAAAALNGREAIVQWLLDRHAEQVDLFHRDEHGGHALDSAVQEGHLRIARLLLARAPELVALPGVGSRSMLHAAAYNGRTELVQWLLAEHRAQIDLRRRGDEGTHALSAAVQAGHLAVARLLVAQDADWVSLPGYRGRSLLDLATLGGHAAVADWLLDEHGDAIDLAHQDDDGGHALESAAQEGHLSIARRLLERRPDLLTLPGFNGRSVLHAAASAGREAVVDWLLGAQASRVDPRHRSDTGTHALEAACQEGHLSIARRLVSFDPGLLALPGFKGRSVLAAAAINGRDALVGWMLAEQRAQIDLRQASADGEHPMYLAALGGHLTVMQQLAAVDPLLVALPGYNGRSVLDAAAHNGHDAVVAWLLQAHGEGIDLRWRNADGAHALDSAAQQGQLAVAQRLVERDPALLALAGFNGRSVLAAAAFNGREAVVEWLLRDHAAQLDLRHRNHKGGQALDMAAEEGHLGIVQRLVAHDPALLEQPGFNGRSVLAAASFSGHAGVVDWLLSAHAARLDLRQRDDQGGHALDSAVQQGHLSVARQLVARDPELVALPGYKGRPLLAAAAANGHEAIVAWLLAEQRARIDLRQGNVDGEHAVYLAAVIGHLGILQQLVEGDPALVALPGYNGRTVLDAACHNGHDAVVDWLLQAHGGRIDLRVRNLDGAHALDSAAQQGHLSIARRLAELDPGLLDLPGFNDRSALAAAAFNGHAAVIEWLLGEHPGRIDLRHRDAKGGHALDSAAQQGHLEIARRLVAIDPALPQLPGFNGRSVLAAAASNGREDLVVWLLAECRDRLDLSQPNADGEHALYLAALGGHLAVARMLADADPWLVALPGFKGRSVLDAAVFSGHQTVVDWLLDEHAARIDLRQREAEGSHVMDSAAQQGHLAIARRLLACDAALLGWPGFNGRSVLAAAALNGRVDFVGWLLDEHAADIDLLHRNDQGGHALDAATQQGHLAIAQRLVAADPRLVSLPGFQGRSVLAAAASAGHEAVVAWLLAEHAASLDLRRCNDAGEHALFQAAQAGHLAVARMLAAVDPELIALPGFHGRSVLDAAAFNGQAAVVDWLLDEHPDRTDLRLRDDEGGHALESAAQQGHLAIARRLVEREPALLGLPAFQGRSVLMAAVINGRDALVDWLLDEHADRLGLRHRDAKGAHALDAAAQQGHLTIARRLAALDPGLVALPGFKGRSVLAAAAINGHDAVVAWLLAEHRARLDLEQANDDGEHALYMAAQAGHLVAVRQLAEADARLISRPGFRGRSVLDGAAFGGHQAVVEWLLQTHPERVDLRHRDQDGSHALDSVAQEGYLPIARRLVAMDAGLVGLPGFKGRTVLAAAAAHGREDIVAWLLAEHAAGVDLRQGNDVGEHALYLAAQRGHLVVARMLAEADPQLVTLPGYQGRSVLDAAVFNGQDAIVDWLLDEHAARLDLRRRDDEGGHPLDSAVQQGHLGIARRLAAVDPEPIALPGYAGRTVFAAAARNGRDAIVDWLLQEHAARIDLRLRDEQGSHALDVAAQQGHLAIAQRLVSIDPDLLALPGFKGRSVLVAAAANGHEAFVAWLLAEHRARFDLRQCNDAGEHALYLAAHGGHLAVVRQLAAVEPQLVAQTGFHDRTALDAAAMAGHLHVVDWLLVGQPVPLDLRHRDSGGGHAMDSAAQQGHLEVARRLAAVDPGLVTLPGFKNRSVLVAAAANGHGAIVAWLLHEHGERVDLRQVNANGDHALGMAAMAGRLPIVQRLLAADPQLVQLPGFDGRSVLHAAAISGREEVVAWLLAEHRDRLDLRQRSGDGGHALDGAAQEGHLAIARLLVQADVSLITWPGFNERSVLQAAAFGGRGEVVAWLLAEHREQLDLHHLGADGSHALDGAAQQGHVAIVRQLLQADGSLLSLPGLNGRSAIEAAAAHGRAEVVAWLLAAHLDDVDLHHRLSDGSHALDGAAEQGHLSIVQLLVRADTSLLHLPGTQDRPVLAAAALNGREDVVRWLLDEHAASLDLRKTWSEGMTALQGAIAQGHLGCARLLADADPGQMSMPGTHGAGMPQIATLSGRIDMVDWVLQAMPTPPDLRQRDDSGGHALYTAAEMGHELVVRCLLDLDPGLVNLPGEEGKLAAFAAREAGHNTLADWLDAFAAALGQAAGDSVGSVG